MYIGFLAFTTFDLVNNLVEILYIIFNVFLYTIVFVVNGKNKMNEISRVRLFADDTILYLTITSKDHCRQLQDDLDALQKYEATWRTKFNDIKCEELRISRFNTPFQHTYYLHGTPLKEVDHVDVCGE